MKPTPDSDDEFELSSGRRFYAYGQILGLSPSADHVSYGYDGSINMVNEWFEAGDAEDEKSWSAAERAELADYMIGLWTRFKEAAQDSVA